MVHNHSFGCASRTRCRQNFSSSVLLTNCLLLAMAGGVLNTEKAFAQSGTLMQWNSPLAGEGGPNLDEPLVTDRPDFTEASVTIGQGVIQVESGYTYVMDDDGIDETNSHSYPETLLKAGVFADWFELRFGYNYANVDVSGASFAGSEDIYLGTKVALTGQAGILPEMAIISQMNVPTGDDDFTADEVLPGVNWLYSWEINDFFSLAGSSQANRAIDEGTDDAYAELAQSFSIGYSLLDRLGAYTEWFAFIPHSADTAETEHYFDGGITFLITDNILWDIRAGMGLNDAADDFFAGSGISFRFK